MGLRMTRCWIAASDLLAETRLFRHIPSSELIVGKIVIQICAPVKNRAAAAASAFGA